MLETEELLKQFRQYLRNEKLKAWHSLTEDKQLEIVKYAFDNATEIDLQRLVKIASRWRGDEDIPMSLPEWVMLIWERNRYGKSIET